MESPAESKLAISSGASASQELSKLRTNLKISRGINVFLGTSLLVLFVQFVHFCHEVPEMVSQGMSEAVKRATDVTKEMTPIVLYRGYCLGYQDAQKGNPLLTDVDAVVALSKLEYSRTDSSGLNQQPSK